MSFSGMVSGGPRTAINRLVERFVERGAVARGSAMTLDQLGIAHKTPAFEMLHLRRYLVEVDGDRYYFDAEEWESNPLHKARQMMTDRLAGLEKDGPDDYTGGDTPA